MDDLLTPEQVAAMLGTKAATLATWRCSARYPLSYVKVGRLVRYERSSVEAFIARGRVVAVEA